MSKAGIDTKINLLKSKIYILVLDMAPIFTSDKSGNDDSGDGSESKPFKTVLKAMHHSGVEQFPQIMVDSKDPEKPGFDVIAKAQLKKMTKLFEQDKRKQENKKKQEVSFVEL